MDQLTLTVTAPEGHPAADDDLRDLFRRLGEEPEIDGVRLCEDPAAPGTLGGALTALEIIMTSSAVTALASVLRAWIRVRAVPVKVSVRRPHGDQESEVVVEAQVAGFDAETFGRTLVEAMERAGQR
ncbi:hypothetical protein GR925_29350 [Streptomyces sp. HUCO-GS316]|uniref:effector-associated constant component EACC1 n=1 Tax=Streptomyces sp. HUCO-GS316 TaxID=2692198 RepID=UPI00136F0B86|nr:hypothetical protein [Streptomyces sp. HUCO-GS316]MXM67427.1 hypothetical protein [Streptomyces sp. HUCO-GS316]